MGEPVTTGAAATGECFPKLLKEADERGWIDRLFEIFHRKPKILVVRRPSFNGSGAGEGPRHKGPPVRKRTATDY